MDNRPSFFTYAKYLYKKLFGTSYASTAILCKSGKQYAQVTSGFFKAFRFLYFSGTVFTGFILLLFYSSLIGFTFTAASLLVYVAISIFRYFFIRFVEVNDDGRPIESPNSQDILTLEKPSFVDYLKNWRRIKGAVDVKIPIVYKGQEYYSNSSRPLAALIWILLFSLVQLWIRFAIYISFAYNFLIFIGIILVVLLLSPLVYFFSVFHHEKDYEDMPLFDKQTTNYKLTSLDYIMRGIVIVLVIIPVFFINRLPIHECIKMNGDTTYDEAYIMAQEFAIEKCGDEASLSHYIICLDGKEAVQKRQPNDWELYFHNSPTGIFSRPSQTMSISKNAGSVNMYTYHDFAVPSKSMINAPTLPVDADEILSILETELEISVDDMKATFIRISGGVGIESLERNTCIVSIENKEYMVDFENKTAHVHK